MFAVHSSTIEAHSCLLARPYEQPKTTYVQNPTTRSIIQYDAVPPMA